MTARRRIVLWRHGQTAWNLEHRFQGKTDIPLDEIGIEQAARAARLLAALGPAAIVSSDLQRARQTADALARLTGLSVSCDAGLRERDGGEWEGLTRPEIQKRWPAEHAAWQAPGGETSSTVAARVVPAFERALERMPAAGPLVIVGHGAALRLGMAKLLGLPEARWGLLGGLANCCWSVIEDGRDGWRLIEHNAGTLPEPVLSDDRNGNVA